MHTTLFKTTVFRTTRFHYIMFQTILFQTTKSGTTTPDGTILKGGSVFVQQSLPIPPQIQGGGDYYPIQSTELDGSYP